MAKMMLHRDVLKNFGKLPAKVQKKVYELTYKFESDSTQASIHLEPITTAKDKKVRSARVGLDYRAIVIAPEKGDTYLLMHIDHHDEAYQWCMNKQFEAHMALGTFQVFDVELAEQSVTDAEAEAAYSETDAGSYVLQKLSNQELFEAGVPEALIPAVRAVRDDEDFERLSDYLPPEASQILYGIAAGMSLDDALNEMLGGIDEIEKPSTPGDFSHLADMTNMDLVLVQGEEHLQEILSEDIEEWRIFLHPYQRKLVEWDTKGPMKIFGAAGTGKTVALMHRAAWLGHQCEGDEKVLITTYTTNLSVTIKGLMAKLAPGVVDRIEVTNLHQLARTICFRAQGQAKIAEPDDLKAVWRQVMTTPAATDVGFSPDFIREEFEQVIDPMGITIEDDYLTMVRSGRPVLRRKQRRQLWKLFVEARRQLEYRRLVTFDGLIHQARLVAEKGKFPGYRYVLVDETQDFGLEALRLIAAISPIKEGLRNPLCVVGDGHQRIYTTVPVPMARAGIDVRGRSRRLKINYRTSEEIRDWAHGVLQGMTIDDLDGEDVLTQGDRSVFHGPKPRLVKCASDDQMAEAAVTWVQGLIESGEIATHEICLTPPNSKVINALESNGLGTVELKARQADPGQEEGGIRFGTKKRIKGLEFKALAILDFGDSEDLLARFENYVAATRARQQLLVVTRDAGE
ncbi:UvrD-helicase domain-containing protein [uncultured Alcanivorax sp.]|uniref:UvrD-helicase domain-containing protein n=1 Tax=uncultured Alcanivorax sp. TaxID=191215 RepID=UPI002632D360|nr:UvrD-helicase domain-containing protein [uncultured Alcanivorax sp.]